MTEDLVPIVELLMAVWASLVLVNVGGAAVAKVGA